MPNHHPMLTGKVDEDAGDSATPEVFFDNLESVFKVKECHDSKPIQPPVETSRRRLPSSSHVEQSDIKLAKSIASHLGLSDGAMSFDALSRDDQALVGRRLELILGIVANGALVPLLNLVLNDRDVRKLTMMRGLSHENELLDSYSFTHRQEGLALKEERLNNIKDGHTTVVNTCVHADTNQQQWPELWYRSVEAPAEPLKIPGTFLNRTPEPSEGDEMMGITVNNANHGILKKEVTPPSANEPRRSRRIARDVKLVDINNLKVAPEKRDMMEDSGTQFQQEKSLRTDESDMIRCSYEVCKPIYPK